MKNAKKKENVRVQWLKTNPTFLTSLQELEKGLEVSLFQTIFIWPTNYMSCNHELDHHLAEIRYCTQIMVSMFRLSGHSQKAVDNFIDRILSSSRYEFPFPLNIYTAEGEESFKDLANQYISNWDFLKQFEGFKNLMINPKRRYGFFVYVINNVDFNKNLKAPFKIQFDKVTFISPTHPGFNIVHKSVREHDVENPRFSKVFPRFFGKRKLLAYAKLHYERKDGAALEGIKIVERELRQFNRFALEETTVKAGDYLFSEDFKKDIWNAKIALQKYKLASISKFKLERLNNNPFEFLRQSVSPAKDQILFNEFVFDKAIGWDEVSFYWQYIENLFWFQNEKNDKIRAKSIQIVMGRLDEFVFRFFSAIGIFILRTVQRLG